MTPWDIFCALHYAGDLVVLGPRCTSSDCLEPAVTTCYWPGQTRIKCEPCTRRSRVIASHMGFELATKPLPVGQALRDFWQAELPIGEWAVLEVALQNYPSPVERDTITSETSFKKSTRDAYLSRLSAKELVTEPSRGMVRAADALFEVCP